ncbi:MAG: FMN-binding protein [Acholeplasmataceae bacterium]|nr:FMN-binding protein [Acholeplasmataceae bacterium]
MKVFKTALVLTLIGIVCGVAIGFTNYITEPIIERNAQARAREAYIGFFSDLTAIETEKVEGNTYVYEQVKIMKEDVLIGYVFKAKGTNPRGLIDLAVAVSLTGEVKGVKILASENTVGFWDQYNNPLSEKTGTLAELSGVDVIAGVTQSGDLINTLIGAAKAFGIEIIGGEVGVDAEGVILGVYTLESNHTPGFYWRLYPYFESLVGVNISTFDSVDTIAGATISLGLIQELLNAVKAVV